MQTRKRGHKRIKGGLLEEVGPAQTQEQADANSRALGLDASKPASSGLFKKAKDRFRNVGTGIASLTRRFRPAPQEAGTVNQVDVDNAQLVDSSAAVGANPPVVAPVKIKPDNLLVPMVINLENNYVLVGAGKFMINDGNVAKEFIKAAYDKYIEQAKQRLAQPNATGDVATVVRQIVFEEFKDIISDYLINNQLDSAIDYANYANELAMGDLFYNIICVRLLPGISDEDKIAKINKILITPDEIVIDDQSKQLEESMSPADEADIESLKNEFAPVAQGLAVEEAASAASQVAAPLPPAAAPVVQQTIDNQNTLAQQAVGGILSQAVANRTAPAPVQSLLTGIRQQKDNLRHVVPESKTTGLPNSLANSGLLEREMANRRKSINPDENESTDAATPGELGGGGARSKKTRKRRQKRSKRKTVHYLRKRH